MKRIISVLAVFTVLSVFAAPVAVFAADPIGGPSECRQLRRSVKVDNETFNPGDIVGPRTGASCIINNADKSSSIKADARWGIVCALNVLNSVIDWVFVILIGIAGLFVIIGAMNLLLSAGSEEKINNGRNYILYALVGVAVAFLARAIPSIVTLIIGV